MADSRSSPRSARIAVWLAFAIALAAAAAMLAAGLGSRFGLLEYGFAFALLRVAGGLGAAGAVLCLAALPLARRLGERRALAALLIGVVAGALGFGVAWTIERAASGAPPLHDISTDTADPPQFVALAAVRRASPNGAAYPGAAAAEVQRKAYPDILPLAVGTHPQAAYRRCLEAARALGWRIALADPQAMRIEATDTTRFFGMKNDIVIRVTPLGAASRVDIRSASRVGEGDLGTNARRIRAFYREMARKG
ncbi:MAG TPA: DUF1499 domain-containing protein [Burkholderiales bacterium]|nr:DUF1499 domain-containing protein [Burkholderiales bacterium]